MAWNMFGTIFAGALAPVYVRRGQRQNPSIRDDASGAVNMGLPDFTSAVAASAPAR
jgi:hypothetical protein